MKRMRLMLLLGVCFFPGPQRIVAQDQTKITADVVYGHKDGLALTMDVFTPAKPNGCGVLFMVSGGWYSRYIDPSRAQERFVPLLKSGFTVFAVRHGSSPRYLIPEIIGDVRRSVRFVRFHADKFGVAPDRLGVYGGSAGGHLSLVLGTSSDKGNLAAPDPILKTTDRVAAVVAYYPPTDLRPWVTDINSPYYKNYPALRFDAKQAAACSPLLQVTPDDAPTLLIHGDQDKLVPIEHSHNIMREFRTHKVDAKLLIIKDAAHGFRGEDAQTTDIATVKWFQDHLLTKEASP